MTDDITKFTLKFGGEENDINAATYGLVLINIVVLLDEANKELQTGIYFEIKVKSERKGSYLVDLSIQAAAAIATITPLLTRENIEAVRNAATKVVSTVTQALDLYKKLKGEKPKEVTEKADVHILVDGDNNKITVDKSVKHLVLDSKATRAAIENIFSALSNDRNIENFTVLDEQETPLFIAEKEEFLELSQKIDIVQPDKQTIPEITYLHITRQSFEPNKKSDFLYKGTHISTSITDNDFWKAVNEGGRFGKGDIILAELEIEQEFNKSLNRYENKDYKVTKVIQHIAHQEQSVLVKTNDIQKNSDEEIEPIRNQLFRNPAWRVIRVLIYTFAVIGLCFVIAYFYMAFFHFT